MVVLSLDDPQATDSALVGLHAAHIASQRQIDGATPPGFVVTTTAYRTAPHGALTSEMQAVIATAYAELGDAALVHVSASPVVASSEIDHVENVSGLPDLLRAIEHCWSSASRGSANDRDRPAPLGVLVQRAL